MKKNPRALFLPPSKLKRKKMQGTLSACFELPIGYMKFLFPKEFVTVFGLCKEYPTYSGTLSSLGCKVPSRRLFAKMYLLVEGKGTL
jgi:hypothetical protein